MSAAPRLSVIVPTFERPQLLEAAWESLRRQTFGDFEVLIVDDASRDGTPAKIAELAARDPRVRGLRLATNGGPGTARNAALAECRGELVALLDDDDLAAEDRFARQVALLDRQPEVDFTVSAIGWLDDRGEISAVRPGVIRRGELPLEPEALFRLLFLDGNYLPNATLMARRSALAGCSFLGGARAGEDWFLFLQMTARGRRLATQPDPLVLARRGESHESLMRHKARAFPEQRRAIAALRAWLAAEGRRDLLALHRPALAQQYLREARFWGGLRGLLLCLRATLLAPAAPRLGETWRFFGGLAAAKLRRLLRLPG